jgi:hypothetical protein
MELSDSFTGKQIIFIGTKTDTQSVTGSVTDVTYSAHSSSISNDIWDGSKITAPVSDWYIATWQGVGPNDNNTSLSAFVNNVIYSRGSYSYHTTTTRLANSSGSCIVFLNKGDTFSLREVMGNRTLAAVTANTVNFSFARYNQSTPIFAKQPTQRMKYSATSGSIGKTETVLTTLVREEDTHNAFNPSTGEFTVKRFGGGSITGMVKVTLSGTYAWPGGSSYRFRIYKGVVIVDEGVAVQTNTVSSGSAVVLAYPVAISNASNGDVYKIVFLHNFTPATITVADSAALTYVSLKVED